MKKMQSVAGRYFHETVHVKMPKSISQVDE